MSSTAVMATPGRPKKRTEDRHKPGKQVRIHPALIEVLTRLADQNVSTVPVEVNRLIRESLEKIGMWPPKRGDAKE